MPIALTNIYEMDRRQLAKLTGAMGIGAMFIDPDTLYAQDPGMCNKIKIEQSEGTYNQSKGTVHYWIDGVNFGRRSNLKTRANIALLITKKQKASSYVQSIALIDDTKKVLGVRYFDASIKMVRPGHEFPPYIRFENVEINPKRTYKAIYSIVEGSKTVLYSATLSSDTPVAGFDPSDNSALNKNVKWLPERMREDFKVFLEANLPNATPGLFSTPFQFYTDGSLDAHCSRATIKELGSDGNFKINVDFMHDDTSNYFHYMRYFVIMDPVGRILGFHKRYRSETTANAPIRNATPTDPAKYVEVVPLEKDNSLCWRDDVNLTEGDLPAGKRTPNAPLTNKIPSNDPRRGEEGVAQKKVIYYNIPPDQIADIRDCPYIQIYTEDSFDAMARSIIRLR